MKHLHVWFSLLTLVMLQVVHIDDRKKGESEILDLQAS